MREWAIKNEDLWIIYLPFLPIIKIINHIILNNFHWFIHASAFSVTAVEFCSFFLQSIQVTQTISISYLLHPHPYLFAIKFCFCYLDEILIIRIPSLITAQSGHAQPKISSFCYCYLQTGLPSSEACRKFRTLRRSLDVPYQDFRV